MCHGIQVRIWAARNRKTSLSGRAGSHPGEPDFQVGPGLALGGLQLWERNREEVLKKEVFDKTARGGESDYGARGMCLIPLQSLLFFLQHDTDPAGERFIGQDLSDTPGAGRKKGAQTMDFPPDNREPTPAGIPPRPRWGIS